MESLKELIGGIFYAKDSITMFNNEHEAISCLSDGILRVKSSSFFLKEEKTIFILVGVKRVLIKNRYYTFFMFVVDNKHVIHVTYDISCTDAFYEEEMIKNLLSMYFYPATIET